MCMELRRALAEAYGDAVADATAIVPVAAWPDRLYGTQYLADLVQEGRAPVPARVVDDARFQPQVGDASAAKTHACVLASSREDETALIPADGTPSSPPLLGACSQVELTDPSPESHRLTVIMALYNRGAQLRQWVDALAASDATEKAPHRTVLCVADFASTDAPVEALLATTGFTYRLLPLAGKFAKTVALNACLGSVDGPPDRQLVFTTVRADRRCWVGARRRAWALSGATC